MSQTLSHSTVLLDEAVDALLTDPEGVYVDATFGRGGHSARILARLAAAGRLLAIDKDPEAIRFARERFAAEPRLQIEHGSFAQLRRLVEQRGWLGQVSWGSARHSWMTRSGGSASPMMARSICVWTPVGGRAPPTGSTGPASRSWRM
jgi:hypothetical protein